MIYNPDFITHRLRLFAVYPMLQVLSWVVVIWVGIGIRLWELVLP